jgi:RNA polymerase sigma-70 factor (ECF subfamily)
MDEEAILPMSSEPSTSQVDQRSVDAARSDIVLRAFEEHAGRLTSFAYGMTRDRDVADDLVQEAFLRLVKELSSKRTPDNVGAWLFRVCSNLAMSRGRRTSVAQRFLRSVRSGGAEVPADLETLRRETNDALLAALATVPADSRAALLMAAQGFTGREIAEAIGRTEMATRTMMFRAREKLRVFLVREGVHS